MGADGWVKWVKWVKRSKLLIIKYGYNGNLIYSMANNTVVPT